MRAATIAALGLALMATKSDPLAGRIAGAPVDCVELSRVNGPEIIDEATILYRQSAKRVWRTGPVGTCPALRPLTTLIVDVYSAQICRNDRFRVLEPGMRIPSGYCRFTAFTPYDKPAP